MVRILTSSLLAACRVLMSLVIVSVVVPGNQAIASEWIGSGNCRVELLGPDDEDELPGSYEGKVIRPVSKHRLVVEQALLQMPPLTCSAVQKLVFVRTIRNHAGEEGWVSNSQPDLVSINVDVIDPLQRTNEQYGAYFVVKTMQAILHESTHAADFLLHAHGAKSGMLNSLAGNEYYRSKVTTPDPDPDTWSADANRLAAEMVKINRLGCSLREEWIRVQAGFHNLGMGGKYLGKRSEDETDDYALLTKNGFTSRYGATSVGEDIAEFAAWMLAAPLIAREWDGRVMPAHSTDDHACQKMRAEDGPGISKEMAVLFTKANLLLSAGLVTQEAFDLCVGNLRLLQPGRGVKVWNYLADGSVQLHRNFSSNVEITIGTDTQLGQYTFNLRADGTARFGDGEHPTALKLKVAMGNAERKLDLVSWPRGIYKIGKTQNDFRVEMPEAPAGTFVATEAYLLIPYATSKRIEGSIHLVSAFRPFAPMAVPQTGLPMRFTFSETR